ncbi:hypothetical protein Tco_0439782 [Tanacetum coccineum]
MKQQSKKEDPYKKMDVLRQMECKRPARDETTTRTTRKEANRPAQRKEKRNYTAYAQTNHQQNAPGQNYAQTRDNELEKRKRTTESKRRDRKNSTATEHTAERTGTRK